MSTQTPSASPATCDHAAAGFTYRNDGFNGERMECTACGYECEHDTHEVEGVTVFCATCGEPQPHLEPSDPDLNLI